MNVENLVVNCPNANKKPKQKKIILETLDGDWTVDITKFQDMATL